MPTDTARARTEALKFALQAMRLYAYGYEKSYSRHALREMLEQAGLKVVDETAILFIPGWLRMLDLACHTKPEGER